MAILEHNRFRMKNSGGARKPRVLVVTPQPFFEERGTPIAVALTVRALVELGCDVDLLAFPIGEDVHIPGVRIERCGNPMNIRKVRVGFSPGKVALDASLLNRFEQFLAERDYDVVHAVEEAAWMAAVVCPIKNVPFIYDMASAIPEQLMSHWLLGLKPVQAVLRRTERRVIERAAHVVCSGGLGSYVSSVSPHAAVTEWRFPVSSAPADQWDIASLREQQNISPSDRVVLYTGNFSGYQGINVLLEAFAGVAASDPQLLLVCVGAKDAKEAHQTSRRLPANLQHRVRILPREKRSLMSAWFALADCLVSLRTKGDNIPLKLFEYMAARKPIVASRGPAHQPILNDSRAFLCAAEAAEVGSAIQRVFADPVLARRTGDAAADYASRNFSWPRFRQLVGSIYGQVLERAVLVSSPSA